MFHLAEGSLTTTESNWPEDLVEAQIVKKQKLYMSEKFTHRYVELCLLIPYQIKKSFSLTSGFVSYAMQRGKWETGWRHWRQALTEMDIFM